MKTRARAFSVEIKHRKRTTHSQSATSLARPGAWPNLLPLGDAAKPFAHQELAQAPGQGAVREAVRVFQPPWKGVQPVEMQDKPIEPVTLIERPIRPLRVLPDLTAAAPEQQQRAAFHAPARKRAPKGSLTTKRQSKIGREEPTTADLLTSMEAPAKPAPALNGHVAAAMAMNRNKTRPKIPPGQRWRERRLPRVCWIRRG
jgi:hypothetical protein